MRGRGREVGGTRRAALGLLLLFLGGFGFTTFTHDWIGALPYHDHLLVGARASGLAHHAHRGDPLDHALAALQVADTAASARTDGGATARAEGRADAPGVVSLKPLSGLQPEGNSYTAAGLVAPVLLPRFAERGRRLTVGPTLFATGQIPAPLAPPPRSI